jgi:repressor LexA
LSGRPPSVGITPAQLRAFNEIRVFTSKNQYPPTLQELAAILGVSHSSVQEQISQLIRKGYLRREPGKSRGIAIVREPESSVAAVVAVPIVGRVVAGPPLLAEENVVGEILVEESLLRRGRCFALEVQGDSMKGAGIKASDLLIVRQQPVAENGEIIVALLDGEATVKRLAIHGGQVELQPENPRYRSIAVTAENDLRIVGKVVGIWRRPNAKRERLRRASRGG